MSIMRYVCSLIAGAAISLALLVMSADLVAPATAEPPEADPLVFRVFSDSMAEPLLAERWDDGQTLTGGAHLDAPDAPDAASTAPSAAVRPTVTHAARVYRRGDTWWTRGPIRRVVSFPVRLLCGRVRRAGGR